MASNSGALSDPPHIQDEVNVDSEMEVKDEQVQALPLEVQAPEEVNALPEDVQLPSEEADTSRPSTCQALLASQIGNKYSQIKQAAGVDGLAEPLAGDRCKAMMEVVLKENGRWLISKLVTEHNHPMNTSTHLDTCAKVAISSGLVFESVEAAKDFYYDYSDKLGFKARTGSNRRSAGTGALIMQRYLCCRGSYPLQRYSLEMSAGKRKQGPYNKRGKLLEEVEEKKDGDGEHIEVVDIDNLTEIEGLSGEYFESESESRLSVKSSGGGVFGAETESRALVTSTSSTDATTAAVAYDSICGQQPATSVSSQSKILRELGVRVYRYSSDEKRDIILRYLMKKNNRQSGERTIKFFTTQPPPGENFRQQQNAQLHNHISDEQTWGGKFNGRAPLQDRVVARKPNPQLIEITSVVEEPKIGMLFANEDRAYEFYVRYAGNIGFCVRKGWWDKTSRSVTRLRVYVCSKEGYRPKGFANEMKKARPETRTGCPARMAIKLTSNGKYSVSEFVSEHNHDLAVPLDLQMFKSQKLAKVQFGNHYRTRLIPAEYKNYLRLKQIKGMPIGEAGAMLEYLQRMKAENTSFFYAIQVDEDDQLTNVFWADANSIMDYDYFGDVICFDTTYKEAECGRPFVQFIGVNHHKQLIFFGAAVLYDETLESFKWLFETFKGAMGGKQPKTILTAKSSIMSDSLSAVWPDTVHRYCVWNIYQSAANNLCPIFKETETFSSNFSQCIFESFEEEDFLTAWTSLLEKYDLKGNEWLANLYEERKSWALPYVQDIFYADIFNALRREGINSVLKECLSPEIDFIQFLTKYDEYVKVRRYMEREADYLSSQVISRASPVRLLWQAANVYTHAAFEMFKMEFELLSNCLVYSCGEVGTVSEHEVAVKGKSKIYFVRFDISDSSVFCSCKKFECVGILCCHVLKVLDCRNVKELAPHFFLKRWRKDAKCGLIREDEGFPHQDDPKSFLQQRYSSLCRILYKLAARAAENVHAYAFMENQSEQILEQVERILQTKLLEETSMNNMRKDQSHCQIQGERIDYGNNNDSRMLGGRKKRDGSGRRRKQNGMEMNKQLKGLKGKPDAVDISMDASEPPLASIEFHSHVRNSSSQFFPQSQSVQGPYISGHQFGLGSFQGFHGTPQFTQDFSAPVLQQQPFVGEAHLGQAPEMHTLQFVASNSQLGPQGGDQGHYTIPVWDFL